MNTVAVVTGVGIMGILCGGTIVALKQAREGLAGFMKNSLSDETGRRKQKIKKR